MRRKLLIGLGGTAVLLLAALLLAPSWIDLDGRKPQLAAAVKQATGWDLAIDGPITLSLLPTPRVTATGLTLRTGPDERAPPLAELKAVSVKPALLPLLAGEIDLSEVVLTEPKIALEVDARGTPNWVFAPPTPAGRPAATPPGGAARPPSLGQAVVENGTVRFRDARSGLTITADGVNLVASMGSPGGPFAVRGDALLNGARATLDLAVGAKLADGHALTLGIAVGGGSLGLEGTVSELAPGARFTGTASVSAEQLVGVLGTLAAAAGQPAPRLPVLVAGQFGFDGDVELSATQIASRSFKLRLGDSVGSGSLSIALQPSLAIEGKVAVARLDLDQILTSLAPPTQGVPAGTAPATPATSGGDVRPELPRDLSGRLALEVGELIYNKAAVRDAAVELEVRGGAVAVPRLSAILPGDMVLQARSTLGGDPARPTVSGEFSLVGPRLRQTLAWLAIDVPSVPADKLSRLSLKGRLTSTGANLDVRDAVLELDDVKGSGGLAVAFGIPLSIVTRLDIATLDLDAYLPRPSDGDRPARGRAAPPSAPGTASPAIGTVAPPAIGLQARIGRLVWNREPILDVDVDVALEGATLKLNALEVASLGGARVAVQGTVVGYDTAAPRPDIAFDLEAPDLGRALKAAGASAPAGLGAAKVSGHVAGTLESLAVRDLSVSALGYRAKADGTLALPGAASGGLLTAAYTGSLSVNGQTVQGSIAARFTDKPTIDADLRAGALDLDRLAPSGRGGDVPARAPASPAGKASEGSALTAVDGSLKLVAESLSSGSTRLGNVDLAATLHGGMLSVAHLRGALLGGSLALSGVVDGRRSTLSFDVRGDASNLGIGEMLRAAAGGNSFGGSVRVTVDGRLNASNIALRGTGATAEQIKRTLAGSALIGGHIRIGADKALTTLGTAATGAVGGAIDNVLGSALGAALGTGARTGGIGVGGLLNAVSLILNRFVNHDAALSGQVVVAGGVLTDKDLVVRGDRATAHVDTRTDLAASTTDTVLRFFIAEDPSAPYLVSTARGPTSRLSYGVTRGQAKDPPGMVNTLSDTPSAPITGRPQPNQPSQRSPIPNLPVPGFRLPNPFGR